MDEIGKPLQYLGLPPDRARESALYGDPTPRTVCDKCGGRDFYDVPIHGGRSLRRDCARCGRFNGWVKWMEG